MASRGKAKPDLRIHKPITSRQQQFFGFAKDMTNRKSLIILKAILQLLAGAKTSKFSPIEALPYSPKTL
ncbi:hypothetical protein CQA63_00455 [Helicobacter marmotae]|uniref:Uncharacterized protein n=1 Tax=Helicobacter marmotae TaxID=152490 RepID=A0A3D8I8C3_9HELI|nr:hypothetical protein CQA63_00455 [Helicobacter marmotae]